jgi:hypothetical protein
MDNGKLDDQGRGSNGEHPTGAEWAASERSAHPILKLDRAWEAGGLEDAVGLFVTDTGALRLYYTVRFSGRPQDNVLCVALSDDGVSWLKPDLGSGNNIVMRGAGNPMPWGEFMPCRVLRDDRETDPARRWKVLYWDRPCPDAPPGFCLACSPDGLAWTPCADRPFITNANDAASLLVPHPGSRSLFWESRYLVYQQTWKYNPSLPQERDNLKKIHRRISLWTTPGLTGPWVGPITILEPDGQDEPDIQFYHLTPFLLKEGYGGLLSRHHTGDQTMDAELVTSVDGWTWRRPTRRALLAPGAPGRFDCGLVYPIVAPLRWRGRVLLVYGGRITVHDGAPAHPGMPLPSPAAGIGLAVLSDQCLSAHGLEASLFL